MRVLVSSILFLGLWLESSFAGSVERVTFDLPVAPPTALEIKRGIRRPDGSAGSFYGDLRIPEGANRSPALVLVLTCHEPKVYEDWHQRFADWGYVTLSISRCHTADGRPDDVLHSTFDWKRGASVAFGALKFLSSLEAVDAERIAIIGWSRPGMVPLTVLNYEGFSQFHETQFKSAVAIYPFCSFARGPHRAPILIVSAEKDDYVDNVVCQRNARATKNDLHPMRHVTIKDTYHGFDIREYGEKHVASRDEINPDEYSADGGTVEYSPQGKKELFDLVDVFLRETIRLPK